MSRTIIIKKYPNRRLYNTKESCYITLEDVSDIIKNGYKIQVIDVTTGADVTPTVLTRIVMKKAKNDNAILPVSLLHLVIQYGESHLHDFFEKYLEKTIENYLVYRKQMDDQIHAYMELGMDFSILAEKTIENMDPMKLFPRPSKDKKDEE